MQLIHIANGCTARDTECRHYDTCMRSQRQMQRAAVGCIRRQCLLIPPLFHTRTYASAVPSLSVVFLWYLAE